MRAGGGEEVEEMRELTKCEVAAMWFYHDDYARRGIGAVEYWKQLDESGKCLMREMVAAILMAKRAE